MELRHLRSFAACVERQNFTRAAEALNLTQAGVSQHVAALEKELRVDLFERRGRGVIATAAGQQLYDYARRILDLADEAVQEVGESLQHVAGELRIATSTVPSEILVPDLLATFRAKFPDVRESLTITDSRLATTAVETGEADVGFVGDLPSSPAIDADVVAEDELILVVAAGHDWANGRNVTLQKLSSEPMIVREQGSGSRQCLERALEQYGLTTADLNVVMEVNNNEAIHAAVARGAGVAFLSSQQCRDRTEIATVKIRGFRPRRQLYVIRNRTRVLSPAARQFLAIVRERQPDRNGT